jgi:hypothetical protein
MSPVSRSYYHRASRKEKNEALTRAGRSVTRGQSDGIQGRNERRTSYIARFHRVRGQDAGGGPKREDDPRSFRSFRLLISMLMVSFGQWQRKRSGVPCRPEEHLTMLA